MIKAAGKRLVVREIEQPEEKNKSGLIIPNKREQMMASVIAVGSEVDPSIEIADIVYLPHETGIPIQIFGEQYLSIVENQILASYEEDKD